MTAGMVRVKNEARWIAEVVNSLKNCCDRVLVWDDHSDDGTPDICEKLGCVVIDSDETTMDESRDKNSLLDWAMKDNPDWIIHIDGDEVLEPAAPAKIEAAKRSGFDSICMKVIYLWDDPNLYRTDGHWGRFKRPSMFRPRAGQRFATTSFGNNIHCGNVPFGGPFLDSDIRLKHYGYLCAEDRQRKYEFYNRIDPNNDYECRYSHIVGIPNHWAPGPMTFGRWE
jgi:glycosyltransferase involved in cell wall biosynthesis